MASKCRHDACGQLPSFPVCLLPKLPNSQGARWLPKAAAISAALSSPDPSTSSSAKTRRAQASQRSLYVSCSKVTHKTLVHARPAQQTRGGHRPTSGPCTCPVKQERIKSSCKDFAETQMQQDGEMALSAAASKHSAAWQVAIMKCATQQHKSARPPRTLSSRSAPPPAQRAPPRPAAARPPHQTAPTPRTAGANEQDMSRKSLHVQGTAGRRADWRQRLGGDFKHRLPCPSPHLC